jgi:hypothetical protein
MKTRIIADQDGAIIAFAVRPATHDPKKDGEIFPVAGHIAHDLEIPPEHEHLFLKEPHKVSGVLRIEVSAGKASLRAHPKR